MSEKEQVKAIELLRKWVETMRPLRHVLLADDIDLLEQTEKFLNLPAADQ